MEEKKIKGNTIQVLYNVYDNFISFCRVETKPDGYIVYYTIEDEEQIDLEFYAIHGYKMLREPSGIINIYREYTKEELASIEESYNYANKRKTYESENFIDLNWLHDQIEANKYDYNIKYPVEQIEIRYSEVLEDYLFLFVRFNSETSKFTYMDLCSGHEVAKDILDLYTYFPRDGILKQSDYSPREIMQLKDNLNKQRKDQTKRLFK